MSDTPLLPRITATPAAVEAIRRCSPTGVAR